MANDEENKGYRVKDRRFAFQEQEEGQARPAEGEAQPAEPEAKAEPPQPEPQPEAKEEAPRPEGGRAPLPPIDFATFIFSLNSSALIHLGELPDPVTGQAEADLELAKQTVDLLGMLKDKTRGNLTPDEEKLLDAILFDLRMRYVKLKG